MSNGFEATLHDLYYAWRKDSIETFDPLISFLMTKGVWSFRSTDLDHIT